ncbi:MAG: hypothetical protein ACKO2L_13915 [Planctomycetaceae bacterium]
MYRTRDDVANFRAPAECQRSRIAAFYGTQAAVAIGMASDTPEHRVAAVDGAASQSTKTKRVAEDHAVQLNRVGVWVDHRSAFVISPGSDGAGEVAVFESGAERQSRRASDWESGPYEPLQQQADNVQQRKYSAELSQYYDRVIEGIGEVEELLIFGPGEAPGELCSRLPRHDFEGVRVAVERADQMTQDQMTAHVRRAKL